MPPTAMPSAPPAPPGPPAGYHHALIARALDLLESDAGRSMDLETLAAQFSLSAAHFQRVFSTFAGVSPKRYQQALALARARPALAAGRPLAEAAERAGLSGPSRLHDLVLAWHAMTPGEFAAGGAARLAYGALESPFGPLFAAVSRRGLAALAFGSLAAGRADLAARFPAAELVHAPQEALPAAEAALARRPVALAPVGGPFQIKVWEALLEIPEGTTTDYGALAARIGHPGAARAVGTAVGANPVAMLIPCHRVLRRSGALGGYRWGAATKLRLLALEAARHDAGKGSFPPI